MSYNNQQSQQQGYGQYNPYGQAGNPYADQGNPYGSETQTSRPQPGPPQGSSYYNDPEQGRTGGYGQTQQGGYAQPQQGGYEMTNVNGNDPNRLLNEIRDIDHAIDGLEQDLDRLASLHNRHVDDTDTAPNSALSQQVTRFSDDALVKYTALGGRITNIKRSPESGSPRNAPQVGKVDRRFKTLLNKFQRVEKEYKDKLHERNIREYMIVRPDASDAEVREALQDPTNTQIFSQALINSDRRGQASKVKDAVQTRHLMFAKIEQEMKIVAQLFQDMEAAVIQQEPAVAQIEQRGEEVTEHVAKGNTELDGAVKKASAARRKKWWCVGIVVLILIIIAVVVAVAVTVTKK